MSRRRLSFDEQQHERARLFQVAYETLQARQIYPLDAAGMPPVGPDFLTHAADIVGKAAKQKGKEPQTAVMGEVLMDLHRKALYLPEFVMPINIRPGLSEDLTFVPGYIFGDFADQPEPGPQPATVMVINKWPVGADIKDGKWTSASANLFLSTLRDLHFVDYAKWYMTYLCKFRPPDSVATMRRSWVKDCLPLLHQELRLVRPKYVLCLGSDVSKALLGSAYSVEAMEGRMVEYSFPLNTEAVFSGDAAVKHTVKVMTVRHPGQVSRSPELMRSLESGLSRFRRLISGEPFDQQTSVDHRTARTLEELQAVLYEIDHCQEKTDKWISVDAEWHGEHPQNANAYIRTIQLSWLPGKSVAIVWRQAGGARCFVDEHGNPAEDRAVALLNRFFADKRVCGHFLVADLEWLESVGLHAISQRFRVPLYDARFGDLLVSERQALSLIPVLRDAGPDTVVPAWLLTHVMGGWDTGLAAHAIEETAMLGLEALAMRYTSVPRYDVPLSEWKVAWCKKHNKKAKDLEGYGDCPDEVIIPYANFDADATLQLMYAQQPLLDCDYDGNTCREPFWEAMITVPAILEMHQEGMVVDRERIDYLTHVFMAARADQETKIRTWARWPDFNIRSVLQVREFLFGDAYNGKRDSNGQSVRLRPEKGRSLRLFPVLDTSKPPKRWAEIVAAGKEMQHLPGTGKTILGVLAHDNQDSFEQIQWLRNYRFLDQVLKSVLRPPVATGDRSGETAGDAGDEGLAADAGEAATLGFGATDNLSGVVYDAGLAGVICDDGRVRTHLYPTAETGRWRSVRPPLQNISKKRDTDYAKILGKSVYKWKLRSILKADPGTVLIEADYKSAELYGMAIMSGDPTLMDHCLRNQLPENDPNYYDIHSSIAVQAFNLRCPPTKKGLDSIGKIALRVGAKNVIFGVAYGRGPAAIALQCKEEGNPITVDEAQRIIDMVFATYPGLPPFFAAARARVHKPGWLCNSFGRFRRFTSTRRYNDEMTMKEFERQAMNFPIQSMVASLMDRAVAYLKDYRDNQLQDPGRFRLKLQIHDALLVAAPYQHVAEVADIILPHNMRDRVAVWPTTLDGVPTGAGPYHLGVDVEVFDHWGEPLTPEFCKQHGIPAKFAKH